MYGKYRNPQYTLRVPAEVMAKLRYIAYENGRTANKEIERLIIAHIKKWESTEGEIPIEKLD